MQQWRKFGIDASMYNTENGDGLGATGDFDVSGAWPAQEPWGAGPDLYRVLDRWNSAYKLPVGERTQGIYSRWSSDTMDDIIQRLRETDPFSYEEVIAIGIEGLKEAVRNMPGIPTYGYIGFVGWDETVLDQLAWQRERLQRAVYPLAQLQVHDAIPETHWRA